MPLLIEIIRDICVIGKSVIMINVQLGIFIFVFQGLQLKGQMVYCAESDSLMFLGTPALDGLESLTSRGLFISDIPLHDATRDVILVGEQARAQVSIRSLFNQNQ